MEMRRLELRNYNAEPRLWTKRLWRGLQLVFCLLLAAPALNFPPDSNGGNRLLDRLPFVCIGIAAAIADAICIGAAWSWALDIATQVGAISYYVWRFPASWQHLRMVCVMGLLYLGLYSISVRNRWYTTRSYTRKAITHILWHVYAAAICGWLTATIEQPDSAAAWTGSPLLAAAVGLLVVLVVAHPSPTVDRWLQL